MKLITGHKGEKHVYASHAARQNIGMLGNGCFAWMTGKKLQATIVSNNEILLEEGDLIINGRHCCIDKGESDSLQISTGTAGINRNDIIVARFTMEVSTGIEEVEVAVKEGKSVTGVASDPEIDQSGDVNAGATVYEMPLYRVKIEGINIVALERLFEYRNPIPLLDLDKATGTLDITLYPGGE